MTHNNESNIINNVNNEKLRDFYNNIKHLDIKNICKAYVRNTLTSLAIEMLAFIIPIIIFAAILSSNSVISFQGVSKQFIKNSLCDRSVHYYLSF